MRSQIARRNNKEGDMTEEERREKVTEAIGRYAGTVMAANPQWTFDTSEAMSLVEEVLLLSRP